MCNLRNMRRFYLRNRIQQPAAELNWSQHVELLPVTNKTDKRRLEKRVVRENLSRRQIRQEVRRLEKKMEAPDSPNKTKEILRQPCRGQPLQCYGLIAPDRVARSQGTVIVDCGFNIWRGTKRRNLYVYQAFELGTYRRRTCALPCPCGLTLLRQRESEAVRIQGCLSCLGVC